MTSESFAVLEEPLLEFRYGQRVMDPHDGLALFGPVDADDSSRPANVRYGVIGTDAGLEQFGEFVVRVQGPVIADQESFSHDLWPPFPGFDAAFASEFSSTPAWCATLNSTALLAAARKGDPHDRAFAVVEQYLAALRPKLLKDEQIAVLFCIVPDEIWQNCRPQSKVSPDKRTSDLISRRARADIAAGQQDIFDSTILDRHSYSIDFRRQLKARVMEDDLPVQIIRESTLKLSDTAVWGERRLTPLSDRAWNICTTAYYKAGGKPWRLATARPGVCYVGLAFKLAERGKKQTTAVCAAQLFLDTGDGIVFKGEYGPWYSGDQYFHLEKEDAEHLLRGVLDTYRGLEGQPLTEVFLHSRSLISREEFEGYRNAVPEGVKLVGIRIRSVGTNGIKLYRPGTRPVFRGTSWVLSKRTALLWGSGFVSRQRQYLGTEVPVPLRIDILHGDADIEQVSRDVLGLTKLNYNACQFGDRDPVTIGFSDAVGEILVANPLIERAHPHFRYYI